jgi:hypothetical protein
MAEQQASSGRKHRGNLPQPSDPHSAPTDISTMPEQVPGIGVQRHRRIRLTQILRTSFDLHRVSGRFGHAKDVVP